MGRIGVISDIHGNLQALQAILKYLDERHCDEIIHTGDVVDIGPNSRECMDLLLSRNDVTLLLGNHDRDFVLNESETRFMSHVPTEHKRHVFATMDESHRCATRSFPLYVTRTVAGKTLMFTHYAFKDEPFDITKFPFAPLTQFPTAEQFDEMFKHIPFDAVFFGHKHEPCDITGERLYVDVGSVGCHPRPYARAIIIDYDNTQWKYIRVEVPYDMEQMRQSLFAIPAGEHLYNFYFLRLGAKD